MLGLPSLHTLDQAQGARIWFAAEATDMRCGFDRLAERVRAVIGQDPLSGHLFVFRSRGGDRLKILLREQDGFVLWRRTREGTDVPSIYDTCSPAESHESGRTVRCYLVKTQKRRIHLEITSPHHFWAETRQNRLNSFVIGTWKK
jgi:hypothetical protein